MALGHFAIGICFCLYFYGLLEPNYDQSKLFQQAPPVHYPQVINEQLEAKTRWVNLLGGHYQYVDFKEINALEYTIDLGTRSKTLVFFKNKKSYHLEVSTQVNLDARFTAFKNSFQLK